MINSCYADRQRVTYSPSFLTAKEEQKQRISLRRHYQSFSVEQFLTFLFNKKIIYANRKLILHESHHLVCVRWRVFFSSSSSFGIRLMWLRIAKKVHVARCACHSSYISGTVRSNKAQWNAWARWQQNTKKKNIHLN